VLSVSDIPQVVDTAGESIFNCELSDVLVDQDGVHVGGNAYPLDETTVRSLGSLLDISNSYLRKCPAELMSQNINYWLRQHRDSDALVHLINNQPRFLKSSVKIIPLSRVVDIIQDVFPPADEVAEFQVTDQLIHIDVISSEHRVDVPGGDGTHRPINDVTHGGIRFRIPIDYKVQKPPEVFTYLNRLVCTNGMCVADAQHKLTLKGRDVPGILDDMEAQAKIIWEKLPEVLESYRSTVEMEVPGELSHFVHQIGTEQGVGPRVLNRAMSRLGEIPAPGTLYDVIQLFTNLANEDNTTYRTRDSLQFLGGELAARPESATHRCQSCARLL
jgi:hypothetical protein